MDLSRRLSPNFTLAEMVRTSHRNVENTPGSDAVLRLEQLCVEFLEPCRSVFGPLWITSGYRSPELNAAIGGSATSAHVHGCAADFVPIHAGVLTVDIVGWIAYGSGLEFDQAIDEYSRTANWIHLGMAKPGRQPRKQALTMDGGQYKPFVFGSDNT